MKRQLLPDEPRRTISDSRRPSANSLVVTICRRAGRLRPPVRFCYRYEAGTSQPALRCIFHPPPQGPTPPTARAGCADLIADLRRIRIALYPLSLRTSAHTGVAIRSPFSPAAHQKRTAAAVLFSVCRYSYFFRSRYRNVTICPRVHGLSGPKCVASMPLVMFFETAQSTASV